VEQEILQKGGTGNILFRMNEKYCIEKEQEFFIKEEREIFHSGKTGNIPCRSIIKISY
jgi:hypothetical protein